MPGASDRRHARHQRQRPAAGAVGTARDLLIGITVVRADGVVAKAGGRVVKNVAGYDLGKLLIGSFGTLAVITEAVFRLHPLPACRSGGSRVAGRRPGRGAAKLVQSVVHAQVVPAAVEVDWPVDGRGTVSVLLGGTAEGVEGRVRTTRAAARRARRGRPSTRRRAGRRTRGDDAAGETGLKLTCALSGLRRRAARPPRERRCARCAARAEPACCTRRSPTHPTGAVGRPWSGCAPHVRDTRRRAVVVDAPREVKQAVDVWGAVPALDLMRRVKDQFDPDHRLAPGRFVGGI